MHLDIKATVSSDHTCKLYQQLQAYISFGFKHTTLTLASRISNMSEPEPRYYEYEPALAAAVTFVVLFLIISISSHLPITPDPDMGVHSFRHWGLL